MEDLGLLLGLFIVVLVFSYCTYNYNRTLNLDFFETKNTEKQTSKSKILTEEQLDAMKTIYDLFKESNLTTSNICKLSNEYCMNRNQNEYCNNDDMIDTEACKISKSFCENPIFVKCYSDEDIFNWINSINQDDKNKLMNASKVLYGI